MKKLNFVDLFAGCGGLSLGLEQAGFHPAYVNELNESALKSYITNRQEIYPHLLKSCSFSNDIKTIINEESIQQLKNHLKKNIKVNVDKGDLDLLVGGPPCQGFSGIGFRRSYSVEKKQLPSNHLYQDMAWIISRLQPKIFLFENVKGLTTSRWTKDGTKGEIWQDVQNTFRSLKNYRIESAVVLAKDYSVPQNRPRVLLVGVRDDINIKNWNNSLEVANGFLPEPLYNPPDLVDLLGDLIDSNYENGGKTLKYPDSAKNDIQKYFRTHKDGSLMKKGSAVTEHEYSKHSMDVIRKFTYMIKNGGLISDNFKTKKFSQRLLPAKWKLSGPNITATSLPDDYVHFSQPRILTVREWARLQGFPDWYQFQGKRTTGGLRRAGNPREGIFDREFPKYTQIGNAVPVILAKIIGIHFKKIL